MSERTEINGVPVEMYGTWCPHGHHVFVADPADTRPYPTTIAADPWPCTQGCTAEGINAEMEAEIDEWLNP